MQPVSKWFGGPKLAYAIVGVAMALVFAIATGVAGAASPERPEPLLPGTFAPSQPGTAKPDPSLLEGAVPRYAKQLGVSEARARAALKQQSLGVGLEEALRKQLPEDFGGLEFDKDNGRWKVFLTRAADEAGARAALAELGIADVGIARVQWSTRERELVVREVATKLKPSVDAGRVAVSSTPQDGVVVKLESSATAADNAAARQAVDAAGDIATTTTAGSERRPSPVACLNPYCDPPLVAGVRYETAWIGGCTTNFAVYVPGVAIGYQLTAGHCIHGPNTPFISCNYNHTWCPQIGVELGGYFSAGGDGGIMQITNGSFPNYPAYRIFGWAYPTYGVLGTQTAAIGQYLCHTGYVSYTTCGFVSSTTAANPMGGASSIELQGACGVQGDSGGPLFDPATGRAVGITSGSSVSTYCPSGGNSTVYEPVNNAMAVFGVSVWHL